MMLPNINQQAQGGNVQPPKVPSADQAMGGLSQSRGNMPVRPTQSMAPDNGQHGGAQRYISPMSGAMNKTNQRQPNPYGNQNQTYPGQMANQKAQGQRELRSLDSSFNTSINSFLQDSQMQAQQQSREHLNAANAAMAQAGQIGSGQIGGSLPNLPQLPSGSIARPQVAPQTQTMAQAVQGASARQGPYNNVLQQRLNMRQTPRQALPQAPMPQAQPMPMPQAQPIPRPQVQQAAMPQVPQATMPQVFSPPQPQVGQPFDYGNMGMPQMFGPVGP